MVRLSAAGSPRVSVIIIFLNEERYLHEAIASVRAQSFADWELILVDDGSTDQSPKIARTAVEADSRIRLVGHENNRNCGMSASRNRGIAEARGEFIAFLDGDDEWSPEKLAEQIAILDAEPRAEMVYGRTLIWHSWATGDAKTDYFYDLGVVPNRLYAPPRLFRLLIRNRAQTPTSINAIMRRALVKRVGGFENVFRGMFEDQVFFAKALLAGPCYVADRAWARYRQHDRSCSARTTPREDLAARRLFLDWVDAYLRQHYPKGPGLRLAVARARLDRRIEQARSYAGQLLGRG